MTWRAGSLWRTISCPRNLSPWHQRMDGCRGGETRLRKPSGPRLRRGHSHPGHLQRIFGTMRSSSRKSLWLRMFHGRAHLACKQASYSGLHYPTFSPPLGMEYQPSGVKEPHRLRRNTYTTMTLDENLARRNRTAGLKVEG
jgi:hypothetical protein